MQSVEHGANQINGSMTLREVEQQTGVPAAVILIWESINGFLPAAMQKLSVLYYLQSICPEAAPIDDGPALLRLILAPAAPASKGLAIAGLLLLTALVLWAASRAVKRIEINYSTE